MVASWEVREGPVLERLAELPAGSVQAAITSPPYYGLRAYSGDQVVDWPAVEFYPMPGLDAFMPPITIPAGPALRARWRSRSAAATSGSSCPPNMPPCRASASAALNRLCLACDGQGVIMLRYLFSFCAAGAGVLLSGGRALAQCTPDCRDVPEPAAEFFRLWLPAVSSWPALAPVCSSDACPVTLPAVVAPALLSGLSSASAGWLALVAVVSLALAAVYLVFGSFVFWGLLRLLILAAAGLLVVAGLGRWYAADPRMVAGLALGFTAGLVSAASAVFLWWRLRQFSGSDN